MKVSPSVSQTIYQWTFVVRAILIVDCDFLHLGFIVCPIANLWLVLRFPNMKATGLTPPGKELQIVLFDAVFEHLVNELRPLPFTDFRLFMRALFSGVKFDGNRNPCSSLGFLLEFFDRLVLLVTGHRFCWRYDVPVAEIRRLLIFLFVHSVLLNLNQDLPQKHSSIKRKPYNHFLKVSVDSSSNEGINVVERVQHLAISHRN